MSLKSLYICYVAKRYGSSTQLDGALIFFEEGYSCGDATDTCDS